VAIADGKILATGSHDRIMSFAATGRKSSISKAIR
jgi:predicted amidohydrolase YtcJ